MDKKELLKKYNIILIMKEMWVWNDETIKTPKVVFITHVRPRTDFPYTGVSTNGFTQVYKYASEKYPNEGQIKIGNKGYFWNNKEHYIYDTIADIYITSYLSLNVGLSYNYFSHSKLPWM